MITQEIKKNKEQSMLQKVSREEKKIYIIVAEILYIYMHIHTLYIYKYIWAVREK